MTSELKPCPFCGGEALIRVDLCRVASGSDHIYIVGCRGFECRGSAVTGPLYETKAEAVEAWNTRAERTCRNVGHEHGYKRVFVCSECEGENYDGTPNYCPECGAKVVE